MNSKQKTSFWSFLQNHEIQIPIIQRDYAQGRIGKEDLRKTFLSKMRAVIEQGENFENGQMILDFVYGAERNKSLNPLDGQQRLTTLWLLHWYVALRSGNMNDDVCSILKHFTYETRVSSREFCMALCDKNNFTDFNGDDIVGYIEGKTWFYSAWINDPTIKAMLKMLRGTVRTEAEIKKEIPEYFDGIEQVFNNRFDYINGWKKLTGNECPIVFYYLPLNDFKLTDDLYLKMNARGKQLTSFENFKAELSKYIFDSKWADLSDAKDGVIIKLDTTWTNIFWRHPSRDYRIDEIYFAFINRFFLNELFRVKEEGEHYLKVGKDVETNTVENKNASYRYLYDPDNASSYGDSMIAFSTIDPYKFYRESLPKESLERLRTILNEYDRYCQQDKVIPECKWSNDFHFIPHYLLSEKKEELKIKNNKEEEVLRTTSLTQVYRIAFYAMCRYFNDGEADEESLKRWMRVVWNLISTTSKDGRPQIRTTQLMLDAIDVVESIPDTHNVYVSLINMQRPDSSSEIKRRLLEEIEKAYQILNGVPRSDGKSWEEIIIDAENFSFFRGTIGFLYHDATGGSNWNDFDTKYKFAKKNFGGGENNVEMTEFAKHFTEADLYTVWNATLSFNNNDNQWKYVLSNEEYQSQIHNFLMSIVPCCMSKALSDIVDIIRASNCKELWILNDWNGCDHVLTNYVQRRGYTPFGYVYQINSKRNDILTTLDGDPELNIKYTENSVGKEYYEVDGKKYYRGLMIYLTYKDHIFAYYGNNTICLLKDDWATKDEFDSEGFYFNVPNDATSEIIKEQMERVLANKNKSYTVRV